MNIIKKPYNKMGPEDATHLYKAGNTLQKCILLNALPKGESRIILFGTKGKQKIIRIRSVQLVKLEREEVSEKEEEHV